MDSQEFQSINGDEKELLVHYRNEHPVKLGELAQKLGLEIKIASLPLGVSGKISKEKISEEDKYIIRVSRFEKRKRQRFTIAHEIAHYLLHRSIIDNSKDGITDNVLYRSGEPLNIEFQANRLAADIIMPLGSIQKKKKEIFGEHPINDEMIEHLANIFEVSKVAMEVRLSQIE